jgi:hypothetical protein
LEKHPKLKETLAIEKRNSNRVTVKKMCPCSAFRGQVTKVMTTTATPGFQEAKHKILSDISAGIDYSPKGRESTLYSPESSYFATLFQETLMLQFWTLST